METKYLICNEWSEILASGLTLAEAQEKAERLADQTVDTVFICAYGPKRAHLECEPDLRRAIQNGDADTDMLESPATLA